MSTRSGWLVCCVLLSACASSPQRSELAHYDPLPALFPVQFEAPASLAGFELEQTQADELDAAGARTLVYVGPPPWRTRVALQIRFDGAFIDGYQAVQQSWPLERSALTQGLMDDGWSILQTAHEGSRSIRAVSGLPDRQGRSRQLLLADAAKEQMMFSHGLYFVDPYLVSMRALLPVASAADAEVTTAAALQQLDGFAAAFIAALEPAESVLCDARVQVLKVREGLSNVSSNGRVIFISTQTDHVDESTVAELRRAATQQRARNLCTGPDPDFSQLEAQMRRRARVR